MDIKERVGALCELGSALAAFCGGEQSSISGFDGQAEEAIRQAQAHNGWFTRNDILFALSQIGTHLTEQHLMEWLQPYTGRLEKRLHSKTLGLVTAGNIPAVGFHDLLCGWIQGYRLQIKLSSSDKFLLPFIADTLCSINSKFRDQVVFTEATLSGFDAVIATGSNNTSRYFEHYFGKYPHIIRRNRNGVAVLSGGESHEELQALAGDVFRYFGLGCRSVSKLFVPHGYDFSGFLQAAEGWKSLAVHHKYASNLIYYYALCSMTKAETTGNDIVLLKKNLSYASPVSVLHYEEYEQETDLSQRLSADRELIQCVVSHDARISFAIPFGSAQKPALSDYSDGVDTMEFLAGI